jgi:hypothetical protein
VFHRVQDELRWRALEYGRRCNFEDPIIRGQQADLRVPGTVAFWIGDATNDAARMGVIVNRYHGIVWEFNALDFPLPGDLPLAETAEGWLRDV